MSLQLGWWLALGVAIFVLLNLKRAKPTLKALGITSVPSSVQGYSLQVVALIAFIALMIAAWWGPALIGLTVYQWLLLAVIAVVAKILYPQDSEKDGEGKDDGSQRVRLVFYALAMALVVSGVSVFNNSYWGQATSNGIEAAGECVGLGGCTPEKTTVNSFARPDRGDVGKLELITLQPGDYSVAIRDYNGKPLCWDEHVESPKFLVQARVKSGGWKPFMGQKGVYEFRFHLPADAHGQAVIEVERVRAQNGVGCPN